MHFSRYSREIVASLLLLNLLTFVSSNSKCATLYNSQSYQGTPLSLQDGSKYPNLQYMSFVPNSIRVTPGCSLTIYDSYGSKQTIDRDRDNLGWSVSGAHSRWFGLKKLGFHPTSQYRRLDASCCECGGCSAAGSKLGSLCARLYENARCDGCSGFHDMKSGDGAKNFGPLNNRMTSVAIRPGCTLTVFSNVGYEGWRYNFTESNNMMGNNWYKQVSSAMCGCNDAGPGPSTYFTTRQPITLPTIQTRPPMTLPTVPTNRPTFYTYPTTRWPMTLPTVPTRPPMTLPTVPTRPPMTLPTVPIQPPMTLPTVPYTTKAPWTLPTVPTTTRAPITLPTVPMTTEGDDWFGGASSEELGTTAATTTTTRTPITLPTVPTTTEGDDWYGGASSEELATTASTTTTTRAPITLPTVPSNTIDDDWSDESPEEVSEGLFGSDEFDVDDNAEKDTFSKPEPVVSSSGWPDESPEEVSGGLFGGDETEDEDDDGWGDDSEEEEATTAKVIVTTTTTARTTTPKPSTTTTTTEAASYGSEEDEEEDAEEEDDWW